MTSHSGVTSRALLMLVTTVYLTVAIPARAGHELEPGQWQLTETGTENGKPAKSEVSSDCLSPEDARDPVKTILKDTEGQQCEARNVKENGNTVVVELKCGDPKEMWMGLDMTINFQNARHYSGTMKSLVIVQGKKIVSEKTMDAVWMAAVCKQ